MSKISVALCTYNGEKYLQHQLESIKNQTHGIHELIVCDDGSKDQTLSILEDFKSHVDFKVEIHKNATNLGSSKNFEKCIQLCTGDVVFLCDQDDWWYEEKVERQMDFFKTNPEIDAVFSNAIMVDQKGIPTGNTSFDQIEFYPEMQSKWDSGYSFDMLLKGYVVTGATLAIRKKICAEVFPVPDIIPELIHDGWISLYLSRQQKIGFISDPLIQYREHASQQVGLQGKEPVITLKDRLMRSREDKLARLNKKFDDAKAFFDYFSALPSLDSSTLVKIQDRMLHYQMRSQLPSNRIKRFLPILRHVINGDYKLHDGGKWWRPALGDLVE
jgi:glycosyltransferase involved in cell wall biosynthesis